MFDLNTVLSAAIAAAVQQAIQPLQQEYANKMAEMAEMAENIAMLEARALAHKARIEALEGVDHERNHALTLRYLGGARDDIDALKARVWALETKLTEADLFTKTTEVTVPIDEARLVEVLDQQEWFWEKLMHKAGEAAEAVAAEAISDHCADHDHDGYDNAVSELEDLDMDDFVTKEEIEEAVNDALDSVTFTVRIDR